MCERGVSFVVTCEHAGNRVPAAYRTLFAPHAGPLASHRGWDPGALQLARTLASRLTAPLLATRTTRLLVEANRSLRHRRLFSDISCALPAAERERVVARWWRPFREAAARAVCEASGPVVHLSAHSFTPVLDGRVRNVDVAFLYDPRRRWERALVDRWSVDLAARRPDLRVRRNNPYQGRHDGHTAALRRAFADAAYAGIEVEVNQAITTGPPRAWRRLREDIAAVVADAPGSCGGS